MNLGEDAEIKPNIDMEENPLSKKNDGKIMLPDGTTKEVSFKEVRPNIYEINTRVEPMYPVILIIK